VSSKPLTDKQREVIEWVCLGKTNGEIAQILGKSERTVHNTMHAVCRKLNACNRTAAAVRYVAPDWITKKLGL
jgi:DNA-binding CsgD family transcriptional regulator